MSNTAATTTTAVVLHNGDDNRITPTSSSSAVVLDALPYVEPLDPNYEHHALSLIEEELQHVVTEHDLGGNGNIGEHPSLRRILPASKCFLGGGDEISTRTLDFGGNAPMATAAYEALVSKRRRVAETGNDDEDSTSASVTQPFSIDRPDPMSEGGVAEETTDQETLVSNLRTSIATSKIRLEQERLRLVNLELHQNLETPARFTAHASRLESQYVNPTIEAVERQRRTVDGINATRMEEQTQSIGKLEGMSQKWELLVDKNRRLGKALVGLEMEVESLKKNVNGGGEMGDAGM
eukprot:CAMPEP_0196139842 /NCGR_PEP_ID=MMETSP0910-20130528/6973_1 /TAXON_ID=49265 /ORGANISM="Thalassiosira rotula, Strain GSO102" /LENGTH=293 /DNA_ID=CAMNT_0041400621 /DNA_START=32 /DNA_END=910 /DNA_ORIENTATION=-